MCLLIDDEKHSKGGQGHVSSKSDRFANYPAADPYVPEHVRVTVLHALGVVPVERGARRLRLRRTAQHGNCRSELFGIGG